MSDAFKQAKQKFMDQGATEEQAAVLAFAETGETDDTISEATEFDSSNFTENDWFNHYKQMGIDDEQARFMAAARVGEINLEDPEVDY